MEHLIMIRRFNGTNEPAPICVLDPEFALRRARSLAAGNCGALVIDEAVNDSGEVIDCVELARFGQIPSGESGCDNENHSILTLDAVAT
jgi:hypothetical protein